MSIPRLAIHRPVTMFMISFVVMLLGGISLTRLPVDLMPESEFPEHHRPRELHRRRSARDGGAGHAAHRAGGVRHCRPGTGQLDLRRRQQQRPAAVCLGHRPERSRRRSAHARRPRARPHAGRRRPADGLQVRLELDADHGHRRRGRLRSGHAPRAGDQRSFAAPRARRRRRRGHHRRRPAPADSRRPLAREDHRPQSVGRSRDQRAPQREPEHSARRNRRRRPALPAAQPRPVHQHRRHPQPDHHDARRRPGVPEGHRRRQRLHRGPPLDHADQRPARHPHARHQAVGQEHGAGRRGGQARRSSGSTARCRRST